MFDDKVILCGSSSYEKIFYFNPEFDKEMFHGEL